ncbi:JAB domain-containing protein [Chlorobium limicola]|uniref:JAB domain-containing protein n=1 Tax=Chlorobium limicola TaxID=1092 RepID=UPI001231C2D3
MKWSAQYVELIPDTSRRAALLCNAHAVFLAHTHPSGVSEPGNAYKKGNSITCKILKHDGGSSTRSGYLRKYWMLF